MKTRSDNNISTSPSRPFLKKIVRKRPDASPHSDRSSSRSFNKFRSAKLDSSTQNLQLLESQSTISFCSEPRSNEISKIQSMAYISTPEIGKFSHCTYQSSLVPKKKIINGQPNDSDQKINANILRPTQAEDPDTSKSCKKINQLTKTVQKQLELQKRNSKQLQKQRDNLLKANQQHKRRCAALEEENSTLKEYIVKLNKKINYEQEVLKRFSSLSDSGIDKISEIQSQREEYLEKEMRELKLVLNRNKGIREEQLEKELDLCKGELYQSNRMIESMKVTANCLQIKLEEQVETSKYNAGQDTGKLKHQNRKLAIQLDALRKEHKQLKRDYESMMSSRMHIEDSFSLNYSTMGQK